MRLFRVALTDHSCAPGCPGCGCGLCEAAAAGTGWARGRVTGMGKHYCRKDGAPVGVMAWPPFADPGMVVSDTVGEGFGRVRHAWRCCGSALVEYMDDQSDPECEGTHTLSVALPLLAPVPHGVPYSVPCVGAAWSVTLVCGHVNGEGCDCDTVAVEAAQGDVRPVLRLVCSECGDARPDADVMGEGVSLGALCEFPVCEGTYGDMPRCDKRPRTCDTLPDTDPECVWHT